MIKYLWVVMLLWHEGTYTFNWFKYDRAAYAAQHESWDTAESLLKELVRDNPDDSSLVYDAGVSAYKSGEMAQARGYFKQVADSKQVDPALKEQSLFNLGNTYMRDEEYAQAIEAYKSALEINPQDERALHNKKIAEEKLRQKEQQQKQDQKKDQKQQDKNKKEDNKKDQQKNQKDQQQEQQKKDKDQSQQQKDQSKDEQKDNDSDQSDGNKPEQKEQEQSQDGKSKDESDGDDQKSQSQDGQESSSGQQQQKEQGGKQGEKPQEQESPADNGEQQKEKEQQAGAGDQGKKEEKKNAQAGSKEGNGTKEQAQAAAGKEGEDPTFKNMNPQLARMLKAQESSDAQLQKQLIRAQVGNIMGGRDGENCW